MVQGTSLFLLGVLACQQLPQLPAVYWGLLLPVLGALGWRYRYLRLPSWFAAGFLWTLLCAQAILATGLDPGLEGRDVVVEGVIAGLPERHGHALRFRFQVERLRLDGRERAVPGAVRLSWYGRAPVLHAGERWRLTVRLKRPHGFMNPGGFDYETWLYRNRLRATGYVREDPDNALLAARAGYPLARLREDLGQGLHGALAGQPLAGMVTALATGDRQGITHAQWSVLTRTGTSHLVAISGLHIGLVAGLVFWGVCWLWSRLGRLALWLPAPQAAAVTALVAAAGYAALAGFSVPTQRALIMVAVAMAAVLLRRRRAYAHTLAAALLFVLLYDPLAVMSGGFWLSFAAVAVILFGMSGRIGGGHWWWRWGRLHLLIAVGLLPVMLVLFQQVPLAGPAANFLAVPWVSFAVVPPVLCGVLLLPLAPALGGPLLQLAATLLSGLWSLLRPMAGLDLLQWTLPAPPAWALLPALLGVLLLIAPRGVPGRWLGVLWLLPALTITPAPPAAGELLFTLLDVGQGLAAVARTHDHVLVYDTGARFSDDFDAGAAVLVPFLRRYGIKTVDTLVIGHGDNDHIGGARSLLEAFPVKRVISSVPDKVPRSGAERCTEGQAWFWDGVRFEVLHPAGADFDGNDASCVLRIANAAGAVLLTGDIERRAEARLLRDRPDAIAASILVAPHHGSKSSSGADFVRAVHPDYVLFPVGYRNRWDFPDKNVIERYRAIGTQLYDTARHGAIAFTLPAQGRLAPPSTYRQAVQRYWHSH